MLTAGQEKIMSIESPKIISEEDLRQEKIVEIKLKWDSFYDNLSKLADKGEKGDKEAREKVIFLEKKKRELEEKIKQMGFTPENYLFWFILVGRTPDTSPDFMELDTPNGDIEKLINELME